MTYTLEFYFMGTGGTASSLLTYFKQKCPECLDEDNVIRLFFSGCQDPNIGGKRFFIGYISPNLTTVTEGIHKCFYQGEKIFFDIHNVKRVFSNSVMFDNSSFFRVQNMVKRNLHAVEISKVILYGYSRGAVTAFLLAKKMLDISVDIEIFAEEPVPGDTKGYFKRYLTSNESTNPYALQACHNIKQAHVLIADHSREEVPGIWHRQIIPAFHEATKVRTYLLPHQEHNCYGAFNLQSFYHSWMFTFKYPLIEVSNAFYLYLTNLHLYQLSQYIISMPNDNTDDNLQDITKAFLKDSQNELISLLIERFKKDYLPRSLKKSYHYGTMGRIDDLESVIGFHQALYELCSLSNKPLRLKQYQAHTAVQKVKTFNVTGARHEYAEIENRILDNKLYFRNNIAVRDLVIEISRTCHYFKEQYAPYTNLIEQCETGLYTCLEQALKPQYTFAATITLSNMRAIIANCSSENVMPKLIGEEFKKTFDYTLSTHPLFHSSMIEFLVAEDNHVVSEDETNAHSTALDLAPLSAFYFTNYLFFASISAREMYFNHYSTTIKTLDFSLDDIKNALILLNQAQAKQLIQFPNIQSRLKQMSSNEIFEFIVSVPVDLREYIEFTCKSHEPQNYILERASCVIS